MTAIGTALVVSSSTETIIAAQFRNGIEAHYAAGAMLERGIADLTDVEDWSLLTAGVLQSEWVDGPPMGSRDLADGSAVDLAEVLNMASCQKSTPCLSADLADITPDRPWGDNNPQWKLYAYGRLRDMLAPGTIDSSYYVVLLVGNGPTPSLLAVRAEAFGPRGAHAIVEVTAGRRAVSEDEKDYNVPPGQGPLTVLSWREVR
jgi:hypothetical protein